MSNWCLGCGREIRKGDFCLSCERTWEERRECLDEQTYGPFIPDRTDLNTSNETTQETGSTTENINGDDIPF